MNTNFKRLLGLLLALPMALCLYTPCRAESDCTPHEWFFKKTDDHTRPTLDSALSVIEGHDCIWLSGDTRDKVIYLTFDAGYENGNVAKVLDALKKHNAPGAFFILENLIDRCPDLVCRMRDEGHLVCNHTARHPDMSAISDKALFAKQLLALEKSYEALTGEKLAPFYRPPQGRFTERNLKFAEEMGYTTVFWSFAYADWDNQRQPDPAKAKEKILAHTHPGMVLLLHPTSGTNAAILDDLLTAWEGEGYTFGSLCDLKK